MLRVNLNEYLTLNLSQYLSSLHDELVYVENELIGTGLVISNDWYGFFVEY